MSLKERFGTANTRGGTVKLLTGLALALEALLMLVLSPVLVTRLLKSDYPLNQRAISPLSLIAW
jgi:hypothetical protein